MGDEAQPHRELDVNEVLKAGEVRGWDPYQVWLTRIRPQQSAIELAPVRSAALQPRRRATRILLRFHWRSG